MILGIRPCANPRHDMFKEAQHLDAQARMGDEIVAKDERRAMILKPCTVCNAAQIDGFTDA